MAEARATLGLDLHLEPAGPGLRRGLTDALREAVRGGRLAPGTRLPSSRALAVDLGIARNTVADAYADLVAEGWLTARQGSGTRVADRAVPPPPGPRPGPRRREPARPAHNLVPGTPDLASFPRGAWLRAARRALAAAPNDALGYGDPRGRVELRTALAGYLARVRGVRTDPDRIVVVRRLRAGAEAARRGAARPRNAHRGRRVVRPRRALGHRPPRGPGHRAAAARRPRRADGAAGGHARRAAEPLPPVPARRRTAPRTARRRGGLGAPHRRADPGGRLRRRVPLRPPAGRRPPGPRPRPRRLPRAPPASPWRPACGWAGWCCRRPCCRRCSPPRRRPFRRRPRPAHPRRVPHLRRLRPPRTLGPAALPAAPGRPGRRGGGTGAPGAGPGHRGGTPRRAGTAGGHRGVRGGCGGLAAARRDRPVPLPASGRGGGAAGRAGRRLRHPAGPRLGGGTRRPVPGVAVNSASDPAGLGVPRSVRRVRRSRRYRAPGPVLVLRAGRRRPVPDRDGSGAAAGPATVARCREHPRRARAGVEAAVRPCGSSPDPPHAFAQPGCGPLLQVWSSGQQVSVDTDRVVMHGLGHGTLHGLSAPDQQMPLPQGVSGQRFDQDPGNGAHGGLDGGHPEALGDHRLELLEYVELVCVSGFEARSPTGVVEGLRPPDTVVRGDEPGVLGQLFQRYLDTMCQRVAGRHGDEDRDGVDGAVRQGRGVRQRHPRVGDPQCGVEFAGLQQPEEVTGGVHAADGHLQVRADIAEDVQQCRNDRCVGDAETQDSGHRRRVTCAAPPQRIGADQDVTCLTHDFRTERGQLHAGAAASEESFPEHPLDAVQL